ncbi:class I SAM-dependent methyltransferase [Thalassotalea fonticola]|uniref:Class I SAM-dependent methyltransferase n=1 Tax=Thalassotalea fonticola TaxID=3065649 RepID=A0ABZ0GU36_9GAMM|nr:class I SAM-dependent methyltransferase [Colwelliaceae bacterium S1-1]
MELSSYKKMCEQQENHWWFKGRRKIIEFFLKKHSFKKQPELLEIGCGPGGNLELLKKFGNVFAVEMNSYAINEAKKHSDILIERGSLPDDLPFPDKPFDIICLFDVLEHVEQDKQALQVINTRLRAGGQLMITVPALPFIYGKHDTALHHYRRYDKQQLIKLLEQADFTIQELSYFNTLLLPLAMFARLLDKTLKRADSTGLNSPPALINKMFFKIFSFEVFLMKYLKLPLGLSMFCAAKKNG